MLADLRADASPMFLYYDNACRTETICLLPLIFIDSGLDFWWCEISDLCTSFHGFERGSLESLKVPFNPDRSLDRVAGITRGLHGVAETTGGSALLKFQAASGHFRRFARSALSAFSVQLRANPVELRVRLIVAGEASTDGD